jgi:hypothetical protein
MTLVDATGEQHGVDARSAADAARRWLRATVAGPWPEGGRSLGVGATLEAAPTELRFEAGVANGTVALATGLALAGADVVAEATGSSIAVDEAVVRAILYLQLLVDGGRAHPPPPTRAARGAICADLGAEGDREAFVRLMATIERPLHHPEELAARAQEWRLPVTPYRKMRSVERRAVARSDRGGPPALRLVDDEATPAPPAAVPPEPASTAAGLGPVPPGATADPPLQGQGPRHDDHVGRAPRHLAAGEPGGRGRQGRACVPARRLAGQPRLVRGVQPGEAARRPRPPPPRGA